MGAGEAAMRADVASTLSLTTAAVEHARKTGDPRLVSFVLGVLVVLELGIGTDQVEILADAEECVTLARHCQAPSALIYALNILAMATQRHDPDRALAAADECIRLDTTHRKTWSGASAATAAKLRLDRGEIVTGLRLYSDILHRLDWSGELFHLVMHVASIAESIVDIDAKLAVEIGAIVESGAIAPFPVFDSPAGAEWLARALENLGPGALTAARARHTTVTYQQAMAFIFDNIDRLIAEAVAENLGAQT
jgi:hypothetical protein